MDVTTYSRRRLADAQHMLAQHRTAGYLLLNTAVGAATGLAFWLLLVRIARLPAADIGTGYAIVSLGTTVALIAKGGLDTALLRNVPTSSGPDGTRLLHFSMALALAAVLGLCTILALAARAGMPLPRLADGGWPLVAAIAALMVTIALQDAWFLAEGRARATFRRNLAFSGARLALPLPVVALAIPMAVPVAWMLALVLAAIVGTTMARHPQPRNGRAVPRREFLRSALRNATGSAAEFLPGLVLVPLVFVIAGATSAGYFGMAWAIATMLTLASAAIGRAALADMARNGKAHVAVRRAIRQTAVVVVPGTVLCAALARPVLHIFGADYAHAAAPTLMVLAASALFVAPSFLYLAVLRAQERPAPLIIFPAGMIIALALLAPPFITTWGLLGVAAAWLLTNAPFGLYASFRLVGVVRGGARAA